MKPSTKLMPTCLLALILAWSGVAAAEASHPPAPERVGKLKSEPRQSELPPFDEAKMERMERHLRTLRAVGLSEALDLSEADAIRLDSAMRPFDERRRSLVRQASESVRQLKQAAAGDATARAQVDEAVQKLYDARAQIAQADRELYRSLAQGLAPEKRARLAIFLARFREQMRGQMHGHLRDMMRDPRHAGPAGRHAAEFYPPAEKLADPSGPGGGPMDDGLSDQMSLSDDW